MKELTLERNLTNVLNVGRPSSVSIPCINMEGFTLENMYVKRDKVIFCISHRYIHESILVYSNSVAIRNVGKHFFWLLL
jgi:hypothetical protein